MRWCGVEVVLNELGGELGIKGLIGLGSDVTVGGGGAGREGMMNVGLSNDACRRLRRKDVVGCLEVSVGTDVCCWAGLAIPSICSATCRLSGVGSSCSRFIVIRPDIAFLTFETPLTIMPIAGLS